MSSGNTNRRMQIDIVSDTICPWCYVGKARLERAIEAYKATSKDSNLQVDVIWHPFQLKPDLPLDDPGTNKREMYRSKFGKDRAEAIIANMASTFEDEGLPSYTMDGLTGSTFNSHRLIAWAGKEHGSAAQNRLVDALFRGYFTEGQYINDRSFLLAAVEKAGLPKQDAAAILDDPQAFTQQVSEEANGAYARGISGVPNFTIGQTQLSGAQHPALLQEAISAWASQSA